MLSLVHQATCAEATAAIDGGDQASDTVSGNFSGTYRHWKSDDHEVKCPGNRDFPSLERYSYFCVEWAETPSQHTSDSSIRQTTMII
jgi:hypothetical protein